MSLVGQLSDVAGGFSQMCSRAAIASASRVAASSPPPVSVDLDLTSPGCPCPVAFDEDVSDASLLRPDLSVTSPPLPREVLPPASTLSADQEAFLRGLFATLQSAFAPSAATGTVRTYEATLRVIAPKVTDGLG